MEGVRSLFRNLDIWVFLVVFFVLGNLYGFIETFLFIYLKETMHAPMYLLGLTITTGAVVSIPFLYIRYGGHFLRIFSSLTFDLLLSL